MASPSLRRAMWIFCSTLDICRLISNNSNSMGRKNKHLSFLFPPLSSSSFSCLLFLLLSSFAGFPSSLLSPRHFVVTSHWSRSSHAPLYNRTSVTALFSRQKSSLSLSFRLSVDRFLLLPLLSLHLFSPSRSHGKDTSH